MQIRRTFCALSTMVGLAACGTTPGERVLVGSAVGAGAAVVTHNNVLAGAAVGAAVNVLYCANNPDSC